MTNRLAGSTSPYLLQHAQNPVDWWEFGPDAFEAAVSRDVPVLLSVGYSACHWCHVMAHESFEDPVVGEYVNERFVAIKVDREQRPDVDSLYMSATQLLTQQGGWPMTVFLTSDGQAFHAGTYYPPQPVQGRPSFMQVLRAVHEAWTDRRDQVLQGARTVTDALRRQPEAVASMLGTEPMPSGVVQEPTTAGQDPTEALTSLWLGALEVARDTTHEGFGAGAKFPPSPVLEALVQVASRQGEQGEQAQDLLTATLDAMVTGALQDHVGGGFFRYSVTPDWGLPHYEKMLYDNAQLLRVLAHTVGVLQSSGRDPVRVARYRHAAHATVEWLIREMITPEGAFAAALDADSLPSVPGSEREGAYYTFMHGGHPNPRPATASWGDAGQVTGVLDESLRAELWSQRELRTPPERDDKVVTAWNGMAVEALAEAAVLLNEPAWLEPAQRAAHFLWDHHRVAAGGQWMRTSRLGRVDTHEGQLEDYARVGLGMLALHRATGNTEWYARSLEIADVAVRRFVTEDIILDSARLDDVLVAAGATGEADPFDNVAASAPSCLVRWIALLGQPRLAGRATEDLSELLLRPVRGLVERAATAAGGSVYAYLLAARPPALLAVVHSTGEQWERVLNAVGQRRVTDVLVLDRAHAPYGVPEAGGAEFTVWLCRDGRCELPARAPEQVADLVSRA